MPRVERRTARQSASPRVRIPRERVEFVLYVSPNSRYADSAQRNCRALLSRFSRSRVHLEVCDISAHPERAEADAVCYTPTLVKRSPPPRTCVVGDLSNTAALVHLLQSCGLDLVR